MGLYEMLEQKLKRRTRHGYFSNSPNYSFTSDSQAMKRAASSLVEDLNKYGKALYRFLKQQAKEMGW